MTRRVLRSVAVLVLLACAFGVGYLRGWLAPVVASTPDPDCGPVSEVVISEKVVLSDQRYQPSVVTTQITVPADTPDVRRLTDVDAGPAEKAEARLCLFGFGGPFDYGDQNLGLAYAGEDVTLTLTSDQGWGLIGFWSSDLDGTDSTLEVYRSPAFSLHSVTVQDGARVSLTVVVPPAGSGDLSYSEPPVRAADGEYTWEWVVDADSEAVPDVIELPEPDLEIAYQVDRQGIPSVADWLSSKAFENSTEFSSADVIDYVGLLWDLPLVILVLLTAVGLRMASRWGGPRAFWRIVLLAALLVPLLVNPYPVATELPLNELWPSLVLAGSMWLALLALTALDRESSPTGRRGGIPFVAVGSALFLAVMAAAGVVSARPADQQSMYVGDVDPLDLTVIAASSVLTLIVVYRLVVVVFARQFWQGIGASADNDDFLPAVPSIRTVFTKALNALVTVPRWLVLAAVLFIVGWVSGVVHMGVHSAGLMEGLRGSADSLRGASRAIPADLALLACAALLAVAMSRARHVADTTRAVLFSGLAWAMVAGLPSVDVLGLAVPLGPLLLAFLVAAVCAVKSERSTWPPPAAPAVIVPARRESGSVDQPAGGRVDTVPDPASSTRTRVEVAVKFSLLLSIFPVCYVLWGAAVTLPELTEFGIAVIFVLAPVLTEILRWMLTGWIYAIVAPLLPGSQGPFKAVMLIVAWFATAGVVEMVNVWNGAEAGREWLFPGLQFAVFLFVLTVLIDINSELVERPGSSWSQVMDALGHRYHIGSVRAAIVFLAPFALVLIALVQQAVSGTGLEFVQSLLSGVSDLAKP